MFCKASSSSPARAPAAARFSELPAQEDFLLSNCFNGLLEEQVFGADLGGARLEPLMNQYPAGNQTSIANPWSIFAVAIRSDVQNT